MAAGMRLGIAILGLGFCSGLLANAQAQAQVPARAEASAAPAPAPTPATVPTSRRIITTAPPAVVPAPAAGAAAAAPNSVEGARQGVVVLERQARPLGLGFVLDGDGRILTALSPLGNGNFVQARYADGSVAPLELVHSDRGWDLALMAPVGDGQPTHERGLRAARTTSVVGLQTFAVAPTARARVSVVPASVKLTSGLLGGDRQLLNDAYELGSAPPVVGGPIVNSAGEVVALVARACPADSKAACVPVPYGVPVAELKRFLQRVPASAPWLGVEAAADEVEGVRGVRVSAVVAGSPAAVAGLRPSSSQSAASGDLIVAVDGAPVRSLAELKDAVRSRVAGDTVELLLYGMGRYRHVAVKPQPAPELTSRPYVVPKPGKPHPANPYR